MRIGKLTGLVFTTVAALVVLTVWLLDRWSHVSVTDSRIAAPVVALSSEVAGRVIETPVGVGDQVTKGDLLLRIDSRQAELQLRETEEGIARLVAEQHRLRAQQAMVRAQVSSRLAAGAARVKVAEAEHRAAQAQFKAIGGDFERAASLLKNDNLSRQQYEELEARFLSAQQQVARTAAGIDMARAEVAVVEADASEVEVLEKQIAVLDAQERALSSQLEQYRIDLERRELRAAFDGVVDATFVDVGEYVAPGSRLLMYHDPAQVRVDANIKETEFRKLKLGAPARITVDAYPGRVFEGEVVRLGHAATSEFALLPSPNPSGNFTKVTQRLPIRIALSQDAQLLRPGMMVEVKIDVVD